MITASDDLEMLPLGPLVSLAFDFVLVLGLAFVF
jgi:hypothetical protein